MAIFFADNAISWSQMRIKGGWRSLWVITAGYAAIASAVITTIYQLAVNSRDKLDVLQGSTYVLEGIQCVLLLVMAPMLIAASIRMDIQTRQIESHRLMPLTPGQAVIGYIIGSTARMLALAGVNIVLGAVIASMAGLALQPLAFAQAVLLVFALLTWCMLAMCSFISRAASWLLMIAIGVLALGQFVFFSMVPALLMICTPLISHTIFDFSANSGATITALIVAMAGQLALCLIFIGAAARKYERDDALALPIMSALAIFVIWIGFSAYSTQWYSDIRLRQFHEPRETVRRVGTIAASWITAGLLISSTMWSRLQPRRRREVGQSGNPSPWPARLSLGLSIVLVTLLAMDLSDNHEIWRLQVVALVTFIFLGQLYVLMTLLYPLFSLANAAVAFAALALCLIPILADLVYYNIFHPDDNPTMDHFTSYSPLGAIIRAYDGPSATPLMPGVAFQFAILLTSLLILRITDRRKKQATSWMATQAIHRHSTEPTNPA